MRSITFFLCICCSSLQAQFPPDIASKLHLGEVWDQKAFVELSIDDRLNRLSGKGDSIAALFSMDLNGYVLLRELFERTARAADTLYGAAVIIIADVVYPPDGKKALDHAYMERAYRDGSARMDITRKYRLDEHHTLYISFVCNVRERKFLARLHRRP